ncbi:CrcB family protein [Galbitalea sp. SE-J8]|uniref:fluoride efflux transporter FluC n=1 Tax=Galbitalea sp. SE-J8 TaxID=3054952 RepID=UPI00259CAAAE|nr:CrcB family protein [Galbitalea sp. SE-J8]MDM4762218.1 CrcB family protein [Galbitalea sp. SE-J8]
MREFAAVVVGAALGTGARLGLDTLVPHAGTQFPVSTFVINLVGSSLLGVVVARLWPVAPAWLRAGLGPGFVGTFTTFSALAVSIVTITDAGAAPVAIAYAALSLVGGLAAAFGGLAVGRRGLASAAARRIGPDVPGDE